MAASSGPPAWVPPGHFYSPLVDPSDPFVSDALRREAAPVEPLSLFGIDEAILLGWFDRVTQNYALHPFAPAPAPGHLYGYENPNFPLADALALMTFLRELQPKRMIEVGSGYSSCAALDINEGYLNASVRLTFIEPLPELLHSLAGSRVPDGALRKARLQEVPTHVFGELEAQDILFIDSSHVAKTGSDVLDYLFRILPALASGVVVHIHDIFYPFEYPSAWIAGENRSWNEAYLLRAFLQGNQEWEVLFFFDWFYKCRRELLAERMPLCIPHRGGSLWLRKR